MYIYLYIMCVCVSVCVCMCVNTKVNYNTKCLNNNNYPETTSNWIYKINNCIKSKEIDSRYTFEPAGPWSVICID